MTKRRFLWALATLVILAGVGLIAARGWLRQQAFDFTGEESLGPQLLGTAQLALNLTTPPLDLQPDAPIRFAGVNPYGINTFLQQEVDPAKRDEQLSLISEAGFRWIRQEFPWQDIEIHGRGDFIDRRNDPNGIDAWAKYDNIVSLAKKYNIQIIARISSPPAWSRAQPEDKTGSFAPPDNLADYANFARTLVSRYKGRIRFYQVWNEPNIYPEWGNQNVDPEGYTKLLCAAYSAIKQADPDAVVISGALAPTDELSGRDFNDFLFLTRMYRDGAGKCFDILSMQGYGLWSGPTDHRMRPLVVNYARNEFIRDIMVRNGDAAKPIWISEMNWNVAPDDVVPAYGRATLDQQARWAPLAYQRAQKEWPWVGVIAFWYFKRADTTWLDEKRPEAWFQMSDPDFHLMPVYDSMKAYTHQPPVLYPGAHPADDFAVHYGSAWTAADGQAIAAPQAAADPAATLTFDGTSIRVDFGPSAAPHSAISYTVDGGQPVSVDAGVPYTVWKGWWGTHTLTINATGPATIIGYTVSNDLPLVIQMIGVAIVVIVAAILLLRRKLPASSTPRETSHE